MPKLDLVDNQVPDLDLITDLHLTHNLDLVSYLVLELIKDCMKPLKVWKNGHPHQVALSSGGHFPVNSNHANRQVLFNHSFYPLKKSKSRNDKNI